MGIYNFKNQSTDDSHLLYLLDENTNKNNVFGNFDFISESNIPKCEYKTLPNYKRYNGIANAIVLSGGIDYPYSTSISFPTPEHPDGSIPTANIVFGLTHNSLEITSNPGHELQLGDLYELFPKNDSADARPAVVQIIKIDESGSLTQWHLLDGGSGFDNEGIGQVLKKNSTISVETPDDSINYISINFIPNHFCIENIDIITFGSGYQLSNDRGDAFLRKITLQNYGSGYGFYGYFDQSDKVVFIGNNDTTDEIEKRTDRRNRPSDISNLLGSDTNKLSNINNLDNDYIVYKNSITHTENNTNEILINDQQECDPNATKPTINAQDTDTTVVKTVVYGGLGSIGIMGLFDWLNKKGGTPKITNTGLTLEQKVIWATAWNNFRRLFKTDKYNGIFLLVSQVSTDGGKYVFNGWSVNEEFFKIVQVPDPKSTDPKKLVWIFKARTPIMREIYRDIDDYMTAFTKKCPGQGLLGKQLFLQKIEEVFTQQNAAIEKRIAALSETLEKLKTTGATIAQKGEIAMQLSQAKQAQGILMSLKEASEYTIVKYQSDARAAAARALQVMCDKKVLDRVDDVSVLAQKGGCLRRLGGMVGRTTLRLALPISIILSLYKVAQAETVQEKSWVAGEETVNTVVGIPKLLFDLLLWGERKKDKWVIETGGSDTLYNNALGWVAIARERHMRWFEAEYQAQYRLYLIGESSRQTAIKYRNAALLAQGAGLIAEAERLNKLADEEETYAANCPTKEQLEEAYRSFIQKHSSNFMEEILDELEDLGVEGIDPSQIDILELFPFGLKFTCNSREKLEENGLPISLYPASYNQEEFLDLLNQLCTVCAEEEMTYWFPSDDISRYKEDLLQLQKATSVFEEYITIYRKAKDREALGECIAGPDNSGVEDCCHYTKKESNSNFRDDIEAFFNNNEPSDSVAVSDLLEPGVIIYSNSGDISLIDMNDDGNISIDPRILDMLDPETRKELERYLSDLPQCSEEECCDSGSGSGSGIGDYALSTIHQTYYFDSESQSWKIKK